MQIVCFVFAVTCVYLGRGDEIGEMLRDELGHKYWAVSKTLRHFPRREEDADSGPIQGEIPISFVENSIAGGDMGDFSISFFFRAYGLGNTILGVTALDMDPLNLADKCVIIAGGADNIVLAFDNLNSRTCFLDEAERSNRNGVHAAVVITGKRGYQIYIDGNARCAGTVPWNVSMCAPANVAMGVGVQTMKVMNGWLRDMRVYPRVLLPHEIQTLQRSCDGNPTNYDEPASPALTSKTSDMNCLIGHRLKSGGNIYARACPTQSCPIACSDAPLCSPPRSTQAAHALNSLPGGLRASGRFGINVASISMDDILERCMFEPGSNVDDWPPWFAQRRLGHIKTPKCPRGPELDISTDVRVLHNSTYDFNGTTLESTISGKEFTLYYWVKNSPYESLIFFYSNFTYAAKKQYCFEFQDSQAWIYGRGGMNDYMDLSPVPKGANFANKFAMRALIVNGTHTTYFVDGFHDTKEAVPYCPRVEAVHFGAAEETHVIFSEIKFVPVAMSLQQLQQIYYKEGQDNGYHECPAGQFRDEKDNLCKDCKAHTFSPRSGQSECDVCLAGSQQVMEGQTACDICPPGKFSPQDGVTCVECGKGTSSDLTGAVWCDACLPGRYAQTTGQLYCDDCKLGDFQPMAQRSNCSNCAPGTFSASDGATKCMSCAASFYQQSPGQSHCVACPLGTITLAEGSTDIEYCILPCPEGSFHDQHNATNCMLCPHGTTSILGSTSCGLCVKGLYLLNTGNTTACVPCPVGTTTEQSTKNGVSDCKLVACAVGQEFRDGSCQVCSPGFQSPSGHSCQPCPQGYFANDFGGNATQTCIMCRPGTFVNSTGSSACTSCQHGKFAKDFGAKFCERCSEGRVATSHGLDKCTPCLAGTYTNDTTRSACAHCPTTFMTESAGAVSPDECTCPEGTYFNERANECTRCEPWLFCTGGLQPPQFNDGYYGEPLGELGAGIGNSNAFSAMKVWHCEMPVCKGIRNHSVCPSRMLGQACTLCAPGYARSFDKRSCDQCLPGSMAMKIVLIPFFFVMLYVILWKTKKATYSVRVRSSTIIAGLIGCALWFVQTLGIVNTFQIEDNDSGPSQIPSYFTLGRAMELFVFLKCDLGSSLASRLYFQVGGSFTVSCAFIIVALFVNNVTFRIVPKLTPEVHLDRLCNLLGTINMVLFVGTCKDIFSYFECRENPTAPPHLFNYPDIECWSAPHLEAAWVIILALLISVITPYSAILYCAVQAPKLCQGLNGEAWRDRLSFLVKKWQPDCWYWDVLYMTRNAFMGGIVLISPSNGYVQIFWLVTAIILTGIPTAFRTPWRSFVNDMGDVVCNTCLVLGVVLWAPSIRRMGKRFQEQITQDAANQRLAIAILTLVILALLALYALYQNRNSDRYEARKGKYVICFEKTINLLHGARLQQEAPLLHLEDFFDSIEESVFDSFDAVFDSIDMLLLEGKLGTTPNQISHAPKERRIAVYSQRVDDESGVALDMAKQDMTDAAEHVSETSAQSPDFLEPVTIDVRGNWNENDECRQIRESTEVAELAESAPADSYMVRKEQNSNAQSQQTSYPSLVSREQSFASTELRIGGLEAQTANGSAPAPTLPTAYANALAPIQDEERWQYEIPEDAPEPPQYMYHGTGEPSASNAAQIDPFTDAADPLPLPMAHYPAADHAGYPSADHAIDVGGFMDLYQDPDQHSYWPPPHGTQGSEEILIGHHHQHPHQEPIPDDLSSHISDWSMPSDQSQLLRKTLDLPTQHGVDISNAGLWHIDPI